MKTLEQIKNDYAKDLGYYDWENLMTEVCYFNNEEFFNHENELLILVQKECLKNASKNVNLNRYDRDEFGHRYFKGNTDGVSLESGFSYEVNKQSITNENNIIK